MIDQLRLESSPELPIIQKQPKSLIIHAGTTDPVKFTSRDILNKLLQLESFIQKKSPDAEITISTPTLRSDKGKATLTNKFKN